MRIGIHFQNGFFTHIDLGRLTDFQLVFIPQTALALEGFLLPI